MHKSRPADILQSSSCAGSVQRGGHSMQKCRPAEDPEDSTVPCRAEGACSMQSSMVCGADCCTGPCVFWADKLQDDSRLDGDVEACSQGRRPLQAADPAYCKVRTARAEQDV